MDTWTPIEAPPEGCVISVDATGRETTITGRRAIMERVFDLAVMPYIECEGLIKATIVDPIPHLGSVQANKAIRGART